MLECQRIHELSYSIEGDRSHFGGINNSRPQESHIFIQCNTMAKSNTSEARLPEEGTKSATYYHIRQVNESSVPQFPNL